MPTAAASVRLITKNVWTQVEADDEAVHKLLDTKLKVWIKGVERTWEYKAKRVDGYEHHYTQRHKFRTGLTLFVFRLLAQQGYEITVVNECDRPERNLHPIDLAGITLRPYQLNAVNMAIEKGRGVIKHGTGGGKTETDAAIVQRLGLPTLMLVDQAHLASQTKKRWEQRLGVQVGLLGAGVKDTEQDIVCATFQSITAGLAAPERLEKRIANAQQGLQRARLHTQRPAAQKRRDKMLAWLGGFDVLVVDEGHHLVAATYQSVADKVPAFYRYVTSATPFKSKGSNNATDNDDPSAVLHVVGTTGPLLDEMTAGDLVEGGYIVRANIHMKNWRAPRIDPRWKWERDDFDIDDDHYGYYTGRKAKPGRPAVAGLYRTAVVEHKERNAAIVDDIVALIERGKPALVFVDKVEHGTNLYAALLTRLDAPRGLVEFIHGKHGVEVREVFLDALGSGKLPVLIASTVLDEGVDIPNDIALVFAAGGKAQHRYIQRIGRGQRLAEGKAVVDVYDYLDTHSQTMWRHSQKRRAAYVSDPAGYTVEMT